MTSCCVHVILLPGCPHPNPADIYRATAPKCDQCGAIGHATSAHAHPADTAELSAIRDGGE